MYSDQPGFSVEDELVCDNNGSRETSYLESVLKHWNVNLSLAHTLCRQLWVKLGFYKLTFQFPFRPFQNKCLLRN